jgi:hypothetical protein
MVSSLLNDYSKKGTAVRQASFHQPAYRKYEKTFFRWRSRDQRENFGERYEGRRCRRIGRLATG